MRELLVWSLWVGGLGIEGLTLSLWLRWRQVRRKTRDDEEEDCFVQDERRSNFGKSGSGKNGEKTAKAKARSPVPQGATNPFDGSDSLEDLGWEYKIVRSHRDWFHRPERLQQVRAEEAEAGWILLEKLDDRRLRFRRAIAVGESIPGDRLRFDPYRSYVGPTGNFRSGVAALVAIVALIVPAYLGYRLVASTLSESSPSPAAPDVQDRPLPLSPPMP